MAAKGALHRAGQALKMPPAEINKLAKTIPQVTSDKAEKHIEALEVIKDKKLRELAQKFVFILQNYGSHASAIVVFPEDPSNWCAIEKQGDDFVAAYDFHELEEMGILKLDILGLKTLDVIQDTLDMIADQPDIAHLPDTDNKTFEMINGGWTKGVFQIESKGMTDVAVAMKINNVVDFSDLVALYRPGPIQSGYVNLYLERRKEHAETRPDSV